MPTPENEAAAARRRLSNIVFLIETQLSSVAAGGEAACGEAGPSLRDLMQLEAALRTRAEALAIGERVAAQGRAATPCERASREHGQRC